MLVTQPDHKVVFLYPGQVLSVVADANSAGTVWRLGDQAGDPSQGSTTIAASGSSTFGPYAIQSRFDVVPSAGALTATVGLSAPGATVQAYDVDLQEIADASASNDDIIQRKAGVWTNRTIAQLKTDLSLSGTNTGDQTSTSSLSDSTDKRFVTDAQRTVIGNTSGANTGDQTLPVKASGAEVNTGTDDAKFVTAKALADSNRAGAHPWELKSSNFTAVVGHRYQVDCSGGVVTMTLPVGIVLSDEFVVEDATLSWATNNLTIAKAASGFGDHVNGGTTNYTADVAGGKLSLVGISAGQGVSIK